MNIRENENLSLHTTMKIGGSAKKFISVSSPDELVEALALAESENQRVFILGGGSNLLVSDAGFDGVVCEIAIPGIQWTTNDDGTTDVTVGAGVPFDDVARLSAMRNLSGIECMSGIPGRMGGGLVQNIGAYGQEIADVFVSAQAIHKQSFDTVTLSPKDCKFSYRHTALKTQDNPYVVTQVTLRLTPFNAEKAVQRCIERGFGRMVADAPKNADEMRQLVLKTRQTKGMCYDENDVQTHSVGSFFVNPILTEKDAQRHHAAHIIRNQKPMPMHRVEVGVKLSAAWLIEQSDFTRGFIHNGAALSAYHCLAIVNRGHASCADVLELAQLIVKGVFKRFHITLEPEVVYLSPTGIEPLPIEFPK